MIWLSWPFGLSGLALAFAVTALGCLVADARRGRALPARHLRGVFTAVYVPLFCAFAAMLTVAPDGVGRVLTFMLCVVASDVGGYAVGVLAGSTPWPRRSARRSRGRASPARRWPG